MEDTHTLYFRIRKRNALNRLIGVLCIVVLSLCYGCATTDSKKLADTATQGSAQSMEEAWGIKVKSLRLSAGGNLLDLRYRVTDPEKASVLFKDKKTSPTL